VFPEVAAQSGRAVFTEASARGQANDDRGEHGVAERLGERRLAGWRPGRGSRQGGARRCAGVRRAAVGRV